MIPPLLLGILFPSLGLSWAMGYGREWLPLLLVLYYLVPLGLHGVGRLLAHLPLRPPWRPQGEALALTAALLPYSLYWLGAGLARIPLGEAYRAFLKGPGIGVPLVVLLAWPLSLKVPAFLASLLTLGLFLLWERSLRWLLRQP